MPIAISIIATIWIICTLVSIVLIGGVFSYPKAARVGLVALIICLVPVLIIGIIGIFLKIWGVLP